MAIISFARRRRRVFQTALTGAGAGRECEHRGHVKLFKKEYKYYTP